MRKLSLIAALSAFALPVAADDAALLMGIERYQDLGRVPNATDVLDSAQDLRRAGYEVTTLSNGSSANMTRLLNRFAQGATEADRLIVGLSGRFVTDGARSWLLATDSQNPTYFGLANAVSIDSVLRVLAQTPGQAVLILGYDMDGNDQIGAYLREGVGDLNIPQGVTVLYGEPNSTDGVVMEAITVPGVDVMAFARDARWLNVAGYAPRNLVMQPDDADDRPPVRNPTQQFWIIAQELNTADAYRDFALNYPRSPYADEARARLDAIESDPVRLAEIAETDLALTRNARRDIQRDLTLLDFSTRGVDGIFGQGSRRAIRNWQQSNGFAQTSFLTAEQINRIDAQASRRAAEIAEAEERVRAQAEQLDRAYWEETGARGDTVGYRAYIDSYPEGIFAEEAREALDEDAREIESDADVESNQAAADTEAALRINPVLARLIENRLDQMGFNPGQIDGRFDSDTRGAISRYQTRNGLPATGYLSEPTLARLLADTFGR
jgi:peptidoglycan hydrolase-like protein with peptidoglycan-binding domain